MKTKFELELLTVGDDVRATIDIIGDVRKDEKPYVKITANSAEFCIYDKDIKRFSDNLSRALGLAV